MMDHLQATGMLLPPKGTWNDISAPPLLKNSHEKVLENSLTIFQRTSYPKASKKQFLITSPNLVDNVLPRAHPLDQIGDEAH
jgi:hypothetical protein